MALIDDVQMDIYGVTGIQSVLPKEPEPPTEEEQLKKFIKDYIDEPPSNLEWRNLLAEQVNHINLYSGEGMRGLFSYYNMIKNPVIIDDFCTPYENPTFKPTKKQARLLKKFRRLKRFK